MQESIDMRNRSLFGSVPMKFIIVGDQNVGKTAMFISYSTDKFAYDYTPTIYDSYKAVVKYGSEIINLQV
jgi:GTPase SAR1 family protein